jgi:hypothetical protein
MIGGSQFKRGVRVISLAHQHYATETENGLSRFVSC